MGARALAAAGREPSGRRRLGGNLYVAGGYTSPRDFTGRRPRALPVRPARNRWRGCATRRPPAPPTRAGARRPPVRGRRVERGGPRAARGLDVRRGRWDRARPCRARASTWPVRSGGGRLHVLPGARRAGQLHGRGVQPAHAAWRRCRPCTRRAAGSRRRRSARPGRRVRRRGGRRHDPGGRALRRREGPAPLALMRTLAPRPRAAPTAAACTRSRAARSRASPSRTPSSRS